MTSSCPHSSRLAHALLVAGVVALMAVGLLGGLHAACDHIGDHHDCAVCRHLENGSSLTVAIVDVPAPAVVAAVAPAQVAARPNPTPLARGGRSPPLHVSVS